jgi:hypothetical protein
MKRKLIFSTTLVAIVWLAFGLNGQVKGITTVYQVQEISDKWRPKLRELEASECPAYKTYIIKNIKRKVYGQQYAKKQNKRLKHL